MSKEAAIALYQPLLFQIAVRMVHIMEDAEDIVQDTLLKWLTQEDVKVQNIKAYLIKSVINNSLSHLQTLKAKKTELLEQVSPSKLIDSWRESDVLKFDLENEVSAALRVVNTTLSPVERAVFLLREAFGFHYDDIQEIVGRKADNCRQLFCRSKEKVRKEIASIELPKLEPPKLIMSFKNAVQLGHFGEFITGLKTDIEFGGFKKSKLKP